MKFCDEFTEYQLLDMDNGKKLELWNNITLLRPDPQIIWNNNVIFKNYDAEYRRSNTGGGEWAFKSSVPQNWVINYKDVKFKLKLMNFKHTGLFPEQAVNWDFISDLIKKEKREIKVLNLFAYTGAASVVALKSGASVVHVDSSKGMVEWAKENVKLNNLEDKPIRFIVDDCLKFVKREINRNNKYDVIIMDPPSFGRGAKGEVWKLTENLDTLIKESAKLLSDKPLLFLVNSYTEGLPKEIVDNLLKIYLPKGNVSSYGIGVRSIKNDLVLPCGYTSYWTKKL